MKMENIDRLLKGVAPSKPKGDDGEVLIKDKRPREEISDLDEEIEAMKLKINSGDNGKPTRK